MASTLLILGVASATLVLVWSLLHCRDNQILSVQDWEDRKHQIDAHVFRVLVDSSEERYLRKSLSHRQFKQFQRRRIRLAWRMLSLVEANTGMLMRLGQLAKIKGDPALTQKANQLIIAAIDLRLNLLLARVSLYLKWLYPLSNLSVPIIETRYQLLLDRVAHLRPQRGEHTLA